jgi:hypothetical protein
VVGGFLVRKLEEAFDELWSGFGWKGLGEVDVVVCVCDGKLWRVNC